MLRQQVFRFIVSGGANTIVGLLIIFTAMHFGVNYVAANTLGYGIGLLLSFSLNRRWTFSSTGDRRTDFAKFLILTAAAYLTNLLLVIFLVMNLDANEEAAQIAGVILYTFVNFFGMKYYAFKEKT